MKWKIKNEDNPYVTVMTKDRHGNDVNIDYHSYLFGLMGAIKTKKDNQRHGLILIVAPPGDGKSTFVEGLAGLDCMFNDKKLELDDIAWSMDSFIQKMDSTENIGRPIWGDEFIQSGGSRGMAMTNVGNKLKIGFVTKRLKKNTYFLVVDQVKEFADKLVDMADALIVIKSFGLLRGYFDCYTNKTNIQFLYRAFKEFNKSWHSPEVKRIRPDCKGKFKDWRGIFLDPVEFDRLKMEQTKQMEEEKEGVIPIKKLEAYFLKMQNPKMFNREIGSRIGIHEKTVGKYLRDIKELEERVTQI